LLWLFFIYFFSQYWGLNSGPTHWGIPPALFCVQCFQDRVLRTICLGWPWTVILLIYASWVARITGVSHQYLACSDYFRDNYFPRMVLNLNFPDLSLLSS
jgi:hypothetical protein